VVACRAPDNQPPEVSVNIENYQTYRGLPPLAGLCPMKDAARPGLSVEESVRRLKRFHYAFRRLHEIFVARLTSEPVYELKTAFAHHAYLCAEHVTALRERVAEMREPPLGLEAVPDPNLEVFFDEILASPTTEELLIGVYSLAPVALGTALEQYVADANRLAAAPAVRRCRVAMRGVADIARYGASANVTLVPADRWKDPWVSLLYDCLNAAGGMDGTDESRRGKRLERRYSAQPFQYDPVPRRDERFGDPYNMGVNAEAFLYDPSMPPEAKVLMLLYKRLREVDVPEMMASILHETKGKPWEYYRAMTRQLWDEARHAMMGEVGFAAMGIDWAKLVPVNFNWSLALNTQLTPRVRHAVLYFIEQGLMPKTGKRYEWEVATAAADPLAKTFQDYDWADEVLHSRIGREWYVQEEFGGKQKEATAYGDACWNKVFVDWASFRDKGLTQHRNWWPDLYREACRLRGVTPDERVAAFHETYEKTRAEWKDCTGSA
jgi:hypothetical protein